MASKKDSKQDFEFEIDNQAALSVSEDNLVPMLNGPVTDSFSKICTRVTSATVNNISRVGTIEDNMLRIFIEKYSSIKGIRTSTIKLMDICTLYFTRQNRYQAGETEINHEVRIPLEEYMKLCGIPDTKASKDKARIRIREDLEALYRTELSWNSSPDKKQKDWLNMRICTRVGFQKGHIVLLFSQDMANYLVNSYIMQYPVELLKADERNPNVYPLGRKLLLHNRMKKNISNGTANVISVKNVLKACPDIPTVEEVAAEKRQFSQRIRMPMERALNSMPFVKWGYRDTAGKIIDEQEINKMPFNEFLDLYVNFEYLSQSDRSSLNAN